MNSSNTQNIIDNLTVHFGSDELIILESQLQNHPSSQRTFFAARPENWIRAQANQVEWKAEGKYGSEKTDPWEALKTFRQKTGGWLFGYLGYDLKNFVETLSSGNKALIAAPDLFFMEPEVLYMEENGRWKEVCGNMPDVDLGRVDIPEFSGRGRHSITPEITKEQYLENVNRIKEMIASGDFYEMNYTYPLFGDYPEDGFTLYRRMREINPVPFGAFLRIENLEICCASPERFLKKTGNRVLSEPIKGTAARSAERWLDETRKNELLNEKNRAENLMIVDLVRHDLSRIAKTGSVKVSKLYDVQTFETVHQLISAIEAEVRLGVDPVDVIKHCFPMGSMTGAPKIEVMKTIERLENYKRGIYSGAAGYITPGGDFDLNVVIRTAILQNGKLMYPVGGAITSDSDPQKEWEETEIKSRSLMKVFSEDQISSK
jgi:para-aminobenzoate synthetase component I